MSEADPKRRRARASAGPLPLPDQVALVLQGGGALGSFQGGVYAALHETGIEVDWVAGISIGAVNAALIAGNLPERRVDRLTQFWDKVTCALPDFSLWPGAQMRELVHEISAAAVMSAGVPGMFSPRLLPPTLASPGTPQALSFYDTAPLHETLDELVDWELLNDGPVRLSVGAVEIASGNFAYFDTAAMRVDARHIMASGALPPSFPPIEIDGKLYWDGGLVSNTPLTHVLDYQTEAMLVFQVDLFSAQAPYPKTILDVMAREKEIRFSSRTRLVTNQQLRIRNEREAVRRLLAKLPPELAADPEAVALAERSAEHAVSIVHLIYRAHDWEGGSRDYEFSARSRHEHWEAGRAAVAETISKSGLLATNILDGKTAAFDPTKKF